MNYYIKIAFVNISIFKLKYFKNGKKLLKNLDKIFSAFGPSVRLGDLHYADEILAEQISTIQRRYSKTTRSYSGNTCQRCGALQGRNYVVEDPHKIIVELWHNHNMEKYLYKNINFKILRYLKRILKRSITNIQE